MPLPVKAFSCEFGCGHRCTTKKHRMAEHEERCFKNPATKSCKTCRSYIKKKKEKGQLWRQVKHWCGNGLPMAKLHSDCEKWGLKG